MIRFKKDRKKYIKICPKCGNLDLPLSSSFVQILAPTAEICNKCGYTGLFPEIDINEIENYKKGLKKKSE